MEWERDGTDWPNREASGFVQADGFHWHVQRMGTGPAVLLVHGTGASSHSFRDLAPVLARECSVVVPDLPGHAFTSPAPTRAMSLCGMADALAALLDELEFRPVVAVGHSAGAAVLAQMALQGRLGAKVIIALNGALLPLGGLMRLLSPMAKLLATTSLVPRIVSSSARDTASVERLIAATGSSIDARGVQLYARLMRDPTHVAGVLSMMANWNIRALPRRLPALAAELQLVAAANDRTVPPAQAYEVAALMSQARVIPLAGLGHLAHEENAAVVAGLILAAVQRSNAADSLTDTDNACGAASASERRSLPSAAVESAVITSM